MPVGNAAPKDSLTDRLLGQVIENRQQCQIAID